MVIYLFTTSLLPFMVKTLFYMGYNIIIYLQREK